MKSVRICCASGEIASVAGTEYDLRAGPVLESAVPGARGGEGFCVNYCIPHQPDGQLRSEIWDQKYKDTTQSA